MTIQETLSMINRLKQEFAVVRLLSADCTRQLELQTNGTTMEFPYRCAEINEICCVIHRRIEVAGEAYTLELVNPMPEMNRSADHLSNLLQRISTFTTTAWRDPLTNAYSRAYFDQHPPETTPVSCVAAICVDQLRETAEPLSSRAAEYALHTVAAVILRKIRSRDLLIRYDENTFLLIFLEVPYNVFTGRLEDIRHTIATQRSEEYPGLAISVSIGGYQGAGRAAVERALTALQSATQEGNTVLLAEAQDTLNE